MPVRPGFPSFVLPREPCQIVLKREQLKNKITSTMIGV
jgi:hypothetical protein